MSIVIAKPPVEVDVSAQTPGGEGFEFVETELAAYIHQCWDRAKFAKQTITERLLQCERQRRGVYDPDKAVEISKTGGSDIYMRLTDIKCRAASAWIKDVMTVNGDRPFDLVPKNEPNIPPEIKASIIDMVKTEAMEYLQSGAAIHPEAFRTRMEEVHDEMHAALAGNTLPVLVRRLVFAGADVTARDAHGNTPLHLAASRGYEPLCDLLLARGADAHAISDDKSTPAMLAIARGFPELGAKLAAVSDDLEPNG